MLLFSYSRRDFPSFHCFSMPVPHLSFSHLTPPVPQPLVSVSVYSLCSPSCLAPYISSPVFPSLCLPAVSFPVSPSVSPPVCFWFSFLVFFFIDLFFDFVCTLLKPLFVGTLSFCLSFGLHGLLIFVCHSALVKIKLAFLVPPILPPTCCLHLGPHLVKQSCNRCPEKEKITAHGIFSLSNLTRGES